MPLFEFGCTHCEERFEKLLGKAKTTLPCPKCGKQAPRVVSGFTTCSNGSPASGNCTRPSGSGFS